MTAQAENVRAAPARGLSDARPPKAQAARPTLSLPPRFSIETADADDQEQFCDVMEMTLDLHAQGGYAPMDKAHAVRVVYDIVSEGMTYVAREETGVGDEAGGERDDGRGRPIGMLALSEESFWYNPGPEGRFLQGMGFWVVPEWRGGWRGGRNALRSGAEGAGRVGMALLKRARAECELRGLIGFITITDPDRRRKVTQVSLESQMLGYVPLGYTLALNRTDSRGDLASA